MVFKVFIGGGSDGHEASMADFSYSVSSLFKGQTDTTWSRAPTINHTSSIDYLGWPKAPGKQKYSWAGYSKILQIIFQESGKSQIFPWNVQGLDKLGLLS